MHLEVDDARLLPETHGLSACFVLPALTVTAGFEAPRAFNLNDPTLAAGFYAAEPEHRWTAGRAGPGCRPACWRAYPAWSSCASTSPRPRCHAGSGLGRRRPG